MSLATGLDRFVHAAFEHAGLARPASLAGWLEQAVAHGPTPRKGPLAHDLVVGKGRVGLNLFQYSSPPSVQLALDWTRQHVGTDARARLEGLLAGLPRTVEVQPGTFWSTGAPRLKLYLGQGAAGALSEPCRRLGLGSVPDVVAVAVDATGAGLVNARAYRMGPAALAEVEALGSLARAWLACVQPSDGWAHPLLTARGRWSEADSKRSLVRTCVPYATLDALWALDAQLAAAGCPALPAALIDFLRVQDGTLRPLGLQLRPVAHEIDLYPDGRAEAEAFVTLARAD